MMTAEMISTSSVAVLLAVLRAAGRAGVAVCLWGDPGIGKSSLVRAVAEAEGLPCETVIGSVREPTDFSGLPVLGEDGVSLAAPSWAQRLAVAGRGVLFLEELSTSEVGVQKAMLGVVLDRQVGDLTLPPGVSIIAAANPPESVADVNDLSGPLANRLLHVDYRPTIDAWIEGMTTGFTLPASARVLDHCPRRIQTERARVAAFIRTRPDLLQRQPEDSHAAGRPWPSRRAWTMAADVLAHLDPTDPAFRDAMLSTVCGMVGTGPGMEYTTWREHGDLPDPAVVLADPTGVAWTELEPSRAWAVLTGLVAHTAAHQTKTAWRDAWTPLAVAAEAGLADIATAAATMLLKVRPANTSPPPAARRFHTLLVQAGLMPASEVAA
jgi:hypothetical protein